MLWAGASTLTVRGSRKSTAGKTLEQAFVRAGLTLLGLKEEKDFWLNMQRQAIRRQGGKPYFIEIDGGDYLRMRFQTEWNAQRIGVGFS